MYIPGADTYGETHKHYTDLFVKNIDDIKHWDATNGARGMVACPTRAGDFKQKRTVERDTSC